jgi:hypothetical protein
MSDLPTAGLLKPTDLKKLSDELETMKAKEALEHRRKEEEEENKLRQDFMQRDIGPEGVDRFNTMVRHAAEQGHDEIQILRFPSEYCSDHGRAINNFEDGWPETLTGFARKVHDAYRQHLAPQGYRMRAQILNYPDGGLGEVGLYIGW